MQVETIEEMERKAALNMQINSMEAAAAAQPVTDKKVTLKGGTELTIDQCVSALDEAMTIIECVGTTGIYSKYQKAHKWMMLYYPNWA